MEQAERAAAAMKHSAAFESIRPCVIQISSALSPPRHPLSGAARPYIMSLAGGQGLDCEAGYVVARQVNFRLLAPILTKYSLVGVA